MATWSELEAARPELMARARELFLIEQPDAPGPAGLGYLATIRADGGPRVHPISPAVLDGRLYAYVVGRSLKVRDLRGDPRFALHSWPVPFGEDTFDDEEVAFTGRAIEIGDRALAERVARTVGDDPETGVVFELHLETALNKHRRGGLTYDVWREDRDGA
jgi:hypothetical protein